MIPKYLLFKKFVLTQLQEKKTWITAIDDKMDSPWGHHTNQNKSDRKKQEPHDLIHT